MKFNTIIFQIVFFLILFVSCTPPPLFLHPLEVLNNGKECASVCISSGVFKDAIKPSFIGGFGGALYKGINSFLDQGLEASLSLNGAELDYTLHFQLSRKPVFSLNLASGSVFSLGTISSIDSWVVDYYEDPNIFLNERGTLIFSWNKIAVYNGLRLRYPTLRLLMDPKL